MKTEWIWESHLPTQLGLNRDELRALRQSILIERLDFKLKKNRVLISTAGVKKLQDHLKLPPAAPEPHLEASDSKKTPSLPEQIKAATGNVQERLVALCVWRTFPKNRHIIEAFFEGTDPAQRKNIVTLKVKDSTRFTRFDNTGKPMTVAARHLQANFYEMAGPMPKHRGRL